MLKLTCYFNSWDLLSRFHYISIKCPQMELFSTAWNPYKQTAAQSQRWEKSAVWTGGSVGLCRGVSGVSQSLIIKRHAEGGAWLFSWGAGRLHLTQRRSTYFEGKEKAFFLKDGERSYSEGRESRKDTISQLSTPAWFSGVSGKGFHTWGNNRAEAEDRITFLHCYPSFSLHQGRWCYPLQGLKLSQALKEQHSVLHSLKFTCAHFSNLCLHSSDHLVPDLPAFPCHSL